MIKIFKFILLLTLFSSQTFTFGQDINLIIKGTVIDTTSLKPIENVNILSKTDKNGTVSDKNGHFSLFVKLLPDTIQLSHIGYKTKTIIISSKADSVFVIKLVGKITTLKETVITSRKNSVYNEKKENIIILDYTFINNDILLLQKEINRRSGKSLVLLNEDFDTLFISKSIPKDSKLLFKDCLNYCHLLTKDSAYQIMFNSNGISFLKPVDIGRFYAILNDCLFENDNNIFFKKKLRLGFGEEIYAINKINKKKTLFIKCIDTTNLLGYLSSSSYISGKYWGHNIPVASIENDSLLISNIRNYEFRSRYLKEIAYKAIENKAVLLHDTLVYFDYVNSIIQMYSSNMKLVRTIIVDYQNNKGWQHNIIKDNVAQKVYTLFKTNGFYIIYEILIHEGRLKKIMKIPYFNTEKIKINNNRVYFLHKNDMGAQNFSKLYKSKIENDK